MTNASFNPCFNGSLSARNSSIVRSDDKIEVSILVLMEAFRRALT